MAHIKIEPRAAWVIDGLHGKGHAAYAVGGCVRDALLGRNPNDWDVCTDAAPERVIEIFGAENCIPTGIRHGTVTVRAQGMSVEVTTLRTEGTYSDGRHPDSVAFVGDVREDLARRDFTVNAMAYCNEEGLIDPFGGQADLERGILRAVGDPYERFSEDALRILRLFRFGAKLGFVLEEKTCRAALALKDNLCRVSVERVFSELGKLLVSERPGEYLPFELVRVCLPEATGDGEQAYARRLCAVEASPAQLEVRLAALLCDAGESIARDALTRLHCSKALTDAVALLVRERDIEQAEGEKALRVQARRCLSRMTLEDIERIKALRDARIAAGIVADSADVAEHDACAGASEAGIVARGALTATDDTARGDLAKLLSCARALDRAEECCRVTRLAVDGRQLKEAFGVTGPALGALLAWLLERVILEEAPNELEALLCAARAHLSKDPQQGDRARDEERISG